MNNKLLAAVSVACLSLFSAGSALAGGLERGGYNIDLLFDPGQFTGEAAATYVNPDRQIVNARDTNPLNGTIVGDTAQGAEGYWVPRLGMKVGAYDAVDCLVDYSQPWGAHMKPGRNWAGANDNIETQINSNSYGATCSYKMDAGKGKFRVIGGLFYQELDGFKERLVAPIPAPIMAATGLTGVGRLDLNADGVGWRAGVAYEIPEIAFRASLVYNSEVDLGEIKGRLDLTGLPAMASNPLAGRVSDVFGSATMPQSIELKMQSGIAPDWLAFGSVKWVDWSVLQTVGFCANAVKAMGVNDCTYKGPGFATSLDLMYRDGLTVQGGIGHKFSDALSGAATVTWDRGTATGIGTQTDTWTFGLGGSYTPAQNIEVRLGGALGVLTSGSSGIVVDDKGNKFGTDVSYDFDNDLVSAVSAGVKVKF